MALVLGATGLFLHLRLRADLDHTLNQGLRARARDVSALIQQSDSGLRDATRPATGHSGADFAQVLDASGRVVDATPGLPAGSLLRGAELQAALHGTILRDRSGVFPTEGRRRWLATPVRAQDRNLVVVVGASLESRDQALSDLRSLLLFGGPAALLLACVAGYGLAAASLRPVEAMRRRAADISTDQLHQRLPLEPSGDELHRLGETLNEMLSRLQTGVERERAFTSDASHELRTPLTMLKTELELMGRDHPSGAQLDAAVQAAVDEAERMARLIDDLLVLARSDADQVLIAPGPVDVDELLAVTAQGYAGTGPADAVTVDSSQGLVVLGDGDRLRRALTNLIDNALRHGGTPVRLSARPVGNTVEVHVQDSGPGFPPSFAAHAFERFSRADPARNEGGSGLGLAIVAAIARAHGGSAHVAQTKGSGADVWITLPLAGAGDREPATATGT
jgi:signal transduction histidine kinase